MKLLFRIGNTFFFLMGFLTLYFSVNFLFQFLNIDFTNLTTITALLLVVALVLSIILFFIKDRTVVYFKKNVSFIFSHKKQVFAALLVFQLLIFFSSIALASADTTIVYQITTNKNFASSTDYISLNPNNFLLLIWFKLNYFIFKNQFVFFLGLWNIFFIDFSIILVYRTNQQIFSNRIANITWLISILWLGISPQYIYTYSDSITLFVLSLLLFYLIKYLNSKSLPLGILLGFLLAITYGLRPTVIIYVIAGGIVIVNRLVKKKENFKKVLKMVLPVFVTFILFNACSKVYLNNQTFVAYDNGKSRTLLYYVDLGLTYTGNEHAQLPEAVLTSKGKDRNKEALKDIKRRIKDYTFASFTGHIFYKFYWITGEGNFGWFQERVLSESQRLSIPFLKRIQNNKLMSFIRSYVYVGQNYQLYGLFIQLVWIIVAFGLMYYSFNFSLESYGLFYQITIFGGLLFLMIFEGGRSRYLLQFFPAIVTISSLGLSKFLNRVSER